MFLTSRIAPPRNWQDFEKLCADIWRRVWNDPNTQLNGRQGQTQHGVDIVGRINGAGGYVGVQCKGRDADLGRVLTIDELRRETTKARLFSPPLTHFVIATTAPNDARLQSEARAITARNEREGRFSVDVMGWDDIQLRLADYPELIAKHFPNFAKTLLSGFVRVDPSPGIGDADPRKFFLGWKPTFGDLLLDVDVRRTIRVNGGDVAYEHFKHNILSARQRTHLYLIFGEGGSGKTTFLRRLALDFALAGVRVHRALVGSGLQISNILEHASIQADTPTVLVIDDADIVGKQLLALNDELSLFSNEMIVIAGSRRNEWNFQVGRRRDSAFQPVYLNLLSRSEVEELLVKLERNGALGRLASLSPESRVEHLLVGARRQLLAGLLEATHGSGFREIVRDEYDSIAHERARFLYIAACLFQQLGILLRVPVARALTGADAEAFESEILNSLELVVQFEATPHGMALLPRHRNISRELLYQVCNTPEQQFELALRCLECLHPATRLRKIAQTTAARVGERLLARCLISTEDDAYALIDALLVAGTDGYRLGQPVKEHALRFQQARAHRSSRMFQVPTGHPSQRQFLVAGEIASARIGSDEAARVLSEGLNIESSWHLLTRALAQVRFERGEVEAAEALVTRLLSLRDSGRAVHVAIPISFAMALRKLREHEQPLLALRYLELAETSLQKGMEDPDGYFLARARLLVKLGRPIDAIGILERGRNFVIKPHQYVQTLSKEHTELLATYDAERFYRDAQRDINAAAKLPARAWMLFGKIAVARRDRRAIQDLIERHPNPVPLIIDLTEQALWNEDIAGSELLRSAFSSLVTPDRKVFFSVFAPSVLNRDDVAFRAVLERLCDICGAVRALLDHFLANGDDGAYDFVMDIARRDSLV